jgi:aromatic-L-amino-acid decarboxylase
MTDPLLNPHITALSRAHYHALRWLSELDERPVGPTVGRDELRSRLARPLPLEGMAPDNAVDELVNGVDGGLMGSPGGRFFSWVIGGTLTSALAADWLTTAWDQNAGLFATSPAASVVEEVAGQWMLELLGLPRQASFAFTTGCQMAHFVCLAAARDAVLRRAGWDVNTHGLPGAPRFRVLASAQSHSTLFRTLRFLGLGEQSATHLDVDLQGRVTPESLEQALAVGGPTIVALCAGDLNMAAFDRFDVLIPMARSAGAWVHVDGAFGAFAAVSETTSHLTIGMAQADSWAADAHKWLNVPYDSGFAAVRDAQAHARAMGISASYLPMSGEARDQANWTPELSRRARGFAVYAALRELGRAGVADLVERSCVAARELVRGIGTLPGAQILWMPHLNQGLVRFLDRRPGASDADHDRRTDNVIAAINASGEAFFGGTTWRGRRALRVSVVNWRTTAHDVERAIAAVARVLT